MTQTLSREHRRILETTAAKARSEAEAGAEKALKTLARHSQRLLRSELAGVAEDVKLKASKRFAAALPDVDSESWGAAQLTLLDKISKRLKRITH